MKKTIIPIIILLLLAGCRTEVPKSIEERIFYEIFVQSYYDTDGDGIGDLKGVTSKLDYLDDLGISGIWLMPISPSPTYHKYDVTDYYGIHPDYGNMEDMKDLLAEAHKRDILVIVDMVINHSSSEHFFFEEAKKGTHNPYRDYYVWSSDTLVHAQELWHWHQNAADPEKYYGFFWKGMPDLNFDKPEVREEMKKIGEYWLKEVGVDGFRLDAIRYIYPDSLISKNIEWWQEYRADLETIKKDFYMVAELWADADYIVPFLDRGVHSAFNFDLSFAIEKMLISQKDPGIASLLSNIHKTYQAESEEYYDAIFLKNHDQDRIMSLLAEPGQAKLAASILFTLPGIPYMYYGEEIAMLGMKPDEFIREPMVWDLPGKEKGQTSWIEPQYSTGENIVPVIQQLQDPESVLSHYRKIVSIRNDNPILATGSIKALDNIPDHLCAYLLEGADNEILVIHNLSPDTVRFDAGSLKAKGKMLYPISYSAETDKSLVLTPFESFIQYTR